MSVTPVIGDEIPVLRRAKARFERAETWENTARTRGRLDYKFCEGDSDNKFQWPDSLRDQRNKDDRPTLTINKTRQHCLQIINDAKQNKQGISVRATGNGSTKESADILEGIIRHLCYQSNATDAFDTGIEFQVKIGIGWWRVVTEYTSAMSFNQEIAIKRIPDPFSVYIDPDCKEKDKSDARWAFIFTSVPTGEAEDMHGELYHSFTDKDTHESNIFSPSDSWMTKDDTRVAEYFEVKEEAKSLWTWTYENPQGQSVRMKEFSSDLPKQVQKEVRASAEDLKIKTVYTKKVMWYKIVGHKIVDQAEWLGSTIPLVCAIGEETVIDGTLDRKGHVRGLKDPQRMYNYWTSSAVENVALQSKTPYIGSFEAFDGLEDFWKEANKKNFPYLPYNAFDDNGNPLEKPTRQEPVQMPDAYMKGMEISGQEMMMVSGQYQAVMGQASNERSGKAINERQRQGENSTYHFIDNLGIAIRRTGKIILELIPKVYDTERVLRILANDGQSLEVKIDPNQLAAYQQEQQHQAEAVSHIFNPQVGQYDVEADVGPEYGTARQQAFDAFKDIITQAPEFAALIGDLLLKAGDFPFADEAAERIYRMLPPQALGKGPSPADQQLQEQVQKLTQELTKKIDEIRMLRLQLKGRQEKRDIEAFDADTRRMKIGLDAHGAGQDKAHEIITQVLGQAHEFSMQSVQQAHEAEMQENEPAPASGA